MRLVNKSKVIRTFVLVRRLIKFGALFTLLAVFFSHAVVRQAAQGRIVTDARSLPEHSAVLLLGTSQYTRSGHRNEFFENRISAAQEALESGRVSVIVASGARSVPGYNEPLSMYNALRARGVPSDQILLDYEGVRTLDSVYRMQTVFHQDRFVIVSQRFHLERALFLATHRGIDAVGFPARDATGFLQIHIRLREYFARVQAVLDVYLFGTEPRSVDELRPIEFSKDFTVDSFHETGT